MNLKKVLPVMAIVAGLSMNTAFATQVAFVDLQKVVSSSSEVIKLKKEQETKNAELVKLVEKARKEIAGVSDTKKKQELENKYKKEIADKKAQNDKNYAAQLKVIETSIGNVINQQAKLKGYDMVLAKATVLYGTTDLTEDIINAIKANEKAKAFTPKKK